MFEGIIQSVGKVKDTTQNKAILAVSVLMPEAWKVTLGESVSVNGICSTVAKKSSKEFTVEYMRETLRKTAASHFKSGNDLNLERSLRFGDPINGHFVYGHVDAVGTIKKIRKEGKSKILNISLPKEFLGLVVYKGSVAVDGTALTVSKKTRTGFEVALIPFTLKNTNFDLKKAGDKVNIETDIIGKYIANHAAKANG